MVGESKRAKNVNMKLMVQEPKLALLTNCIRSQAATLRAKVKNEQKTKQNAISQSQKKQDIGRKFNLTGDMTNLYPIIQTLLE